MSWRRALAAACLFGLAGCRTPAPVALPSLAPDDPRPPRLVAEWIQRSALRTALRASARLAVDTQGDEGDEVHLRARQALVVARPAQLRVDVQGLLGTTIAVLAVDGGEYALFESETRRFERGSLEDAPLWRVARLSLRPEDVVEAVLGGPAAAPGFELGLAFAAPEGGVLVDVYDESRTRRSLLFDSDGRLRSLAVKPPDFSAWRATYDDFASVANTELPHTVSLDTGDARAVLSLRDVELNPSLSADIFRLDGLAARSGAEGG